MPKKWLPLESNPEVMTEFASRIGLDTSQVAFHDIFGLDPEVGEKSKLLITQVMTPCTGDLPVN